MQNIVMIGLSYSTKYYQRKHQTIKLSYACVSHSWLNNFSLASGPNQTNDYKLLGDFRFQLISSPFFSTPSLPDSLHHLQDEGENPNFHTK